MFQLPEGIAQDVPQVMDVEEDTDTLEDLLLAFYPGVPRRQSLQLGRLRAVIRAAEKYDMTPCVVEQLHANLKIFLPSDPLRVYCIAYLREDVELVRTASRRLLEHPEFAVPSLPPPEYYEVPAIAIWNAHIYRQKCAEVALEVFRDRDWILSASGHHVVVSRKGNADASHAWVWFACQKCPPSSQEYALSNSGSTRSNTALTAGRYSMFL